MILNTQFSQVHWGRVLLIGVLLAILFLILNLVLSFLLLAFLNWGHMDPHSAIRAFSWIGRLCLKKKSQSRLCLQSDLRALRLIR